MEEKRRGIRKLVLKETKGAVVDDSRGKLKIKVIREDGHEVRKKTTGIAKVVSEESPVVARPVKRGDFKERLMGEDEENKKTTSKKYYTGDDKGIEGCRRKIR
jgi:hypothetical protein